MVYTTETGKTGKLSELSKEARGTTNHNVLASCHILTPLWRDSDQVRQTGVGLGGSQPP